ncbi:putative essential for the formation of DNA replication focal centers [Lyophyllum shimeji]|uniref:Essential for the formation of DNA replication focal centers n=1 Tax=Lyophyllum shimeji TaxID=47721 RepID=A0A9P3PY96_LYOSH|nr:putative essential for the formation of DNA replication focal centers [Lyophyllum shimeji]
MADYTSDDEYARFFEDVTPDQLDGLIALEESRFPLSVPPASGSQMPRNSERITTTEKSNSRAPTPSSNIFIFEPPPGKRRPGRPKGSRNQNGSASLQLPQPTKRPVGRPRGSGPLQLAAANSGVKPTKKRRVGRPKRKAAFGPSKPRSDSMFVSGLPPTGRFRNTGTTRNPSPAAARSIPTTGPMATSAIGDADEDTREVSTSASAAHSTSARAPDIVPEPQLIFNDDPSRVINDDDGDDAGSDDGGDSLLEEGIGEDDGDDAEDSMGNTSSSKVPLRDLPTWLDTAFKAHAEASSPSNRGPDGLPPLYRDRQFWFPKPATFFLLQDINTLSPQNVYDARFFLWDPECLAPNGIVCPNGCGARLQRHTDIPRPRRVVGLDSTFWIIGYRYKCGQCKPPRSVTFRSWDPRILAVLDPTLAAEFPARLTYRSGISSDVLRFMRTCFQHGMGAKQFSNALLVQHLQSYDLLHLRYLQRIAQLAESGSVLLTGPSPHKFKSFLPFDDKSPDGLQGFVPSSQWLRDVYDSLIEEHKDEFNQHMSMLTGSICGIDHSFKLAKHVSKVDGVQVFTALLTVTNEKGEIRVCNLVATKSHSQFELALQRMRASLELYGHDQPDVFYTDNMADKEFLEKCFPSLRRDVVPIEKHSHLDPLSIPDHVQISVKRSITTIDDAMRTLLDLLPDDDEMGSLVIGLDAEWNIETSERGYVTGRGQTAVLQIAHGTNIFIMQIGQMLAGNQLPPLLKQVLANPRILKVGRCVAGDLKYLQQACRSDIPFVGGMDIARLARDRLLVPTARASLSDLSAAVLNRRLNKNVVERISTAWEDEELTREQIQYAALDAYASLTIYHALASLPTPQPLSGHPALGVPVLLFGNDRTRVLARGVVSPHVNDTSYMGINLTPSRSVIEVHEVLVPGALIVNGTSQKQSLESYGTPPFHAVCLRNHLRYSQVETPPCPSAVPQPDPAADPEPQPRQAEPHVQPTPIDETATEDVDGGSGFGDLLAETCQSDADPIRQNITDYVPDPGSQAEGERLLGDITLDGWVRIIRSRILKDPFHVFNMFYISATHGLLHEFAITLRDAMFIWDQMDKSRIIAWGQVQNPPQSWDYLISKRPDWLRRRCKRIIPPAEQLLPLVKNVFQTFGPLKDAKSGLPLFNSAAWAVAKNVLLLIQKGHLSDPPGIPLYFQLGIDAKTDFILRHNLLVGTFNSTGRRYVGHYSIWITNALQETLCLVRHMLVNPREMTGWVNGNLYQLTTEVAGVLPIPRQVQSSLGMGTYESSLHSKQRHYFLASMQGTRKPVLPIHNSQERDLFRDFMIGDSGFNDPVSGPSWERAARLWNDTAEIKEGISYKLTEQLKVYYNGDWKRNTNIKQTKSMTADVRIPLKHSLRDPRRSSGAPKAPERAKTLHSVSQGFQITSEAGPSSSAGPALLPLSQLSESRPPSMHLAPLLPPALPVSIPFSSAAPHSGQEDSPAFHIARKRALAVAVPDRPTKKRKGRTCRKYKPELRAFKSSPGCVSLFPPVQASLPPSLTHSAVTNASHRRRRTHPVSLLPSRGGGVRVPRPLFMDTYFDNGGNILNCSVRVRWDHSVVYTLSTTKGLKGCKVTLLRDENPHASRSRGNPECVGFILWREKAVGVFGQRRRVREVRKRRWRWSWGWGRVWGWSLERVSIDLVGAVICQGAFIQKMQEGAPGVASCDRAVPRVPRPPMLDAWTAHTNRLWDPLADAARHPMRTIPCPKCRRPIETPYMTSEGTGFLQHNFQTRCSYPSCADAVPPITITKAVLGVRKMAEDLAREDAGAGADACWWTLAGTLRIPQTASDLARGKLVKDAVLGGPVSSSKFRKPEGMGQEEWVLSILERNTYSAPGMCAAMAARMRSGGGNLIKRIWSAYADGEQFSADLVGAVIRQGSFVKKMHDLQWTEPGFFDTKEDEVALQHAIARYRA